MDHEQTKQIARNTISSQKAQIKELNGIREGLDGPLKKMSDEDMSMILGLVEIGRMLRPDGCSCRPGALVCP
jgi:hypothetical protein